MEKLSYPGYRIRWDCKMIYQPSSSKPLNIYIYHRATLASTFIGKVIKGNKESDAFKKIVQLKLKIVLM